MTVISDRDAWQVFRRKELREVPTEVRWPVRLTTPLLMTFLEYARETYDLSSLQTSEEGGGHV